MLSPGGEGSAGKIKDGESSFKSQSTISTPVINLSSKNGSGKNRDHNEVRDIFTKLDVASKTLLFEANQLLKIFRARDVQDKEWSTDQSKIYQLMAQIKQNLEEMKDISEDMNAVKDLKISSPRIVDQAKTFGLAVENLKASLRQLQRDFQLAISTKERQDLFAMSRSPFDTSDVPRRRAGGVAEISSGATESMIHSRRILLETVQRSAGTLGNLAHSSSAVQENQEELKSQGSVISASKKLLTKYGRREFTDKILICLALVFFLACVAYVVQKRIF